MKLGDTGRMLAAICGVRAPFTPNCVLPPVVAGVGATSICEPSRPITICVVRPLPADDTGGFNVIVDTPVMSGDD
jgi:hypothetical protein